MGDAFFFHNLKRRLGDDFQIKNKGTVLEVVFIKLHLNRDRQFIPAIDLRPPRQARRQARRQPMDSLVGPQLDQIVLIEQRGPGADKAQIPLDDAYQLRQFIQTGLAQHPPDTRHVSVGITQLFER